MVQRGALTSPRLPWSPGDPKTGIEIRIRDNGSGIPSEIIDDIFNPFFTTKPPDQGTGLGLALSSDIVRQHGGHIRVESEPGAFTEMIVTLPSEPPPLPDDDATGDEAASGNGDPLESPSRS